MYDDSSESLMFRPGEEDRRLDLAEVVPVMVSRALTRFFRRLTSAPGGDKCVFILEGLFTYFFRCPIIVLRKTGQSLN